MITRELIQTAVTMRGDPQKRVDYLVDGSAESSQLYQIHRLRSGFDDCGRVVCNPEVRWVSPLTSECAEIQAQSQADKADYIPTD